MSPEVIDIPGMTQEQQATAYECTTMQSDVPEMTIGLETISRIKNVIADSALDQKEKNQLQTMLFNPDIYSKAMNFVDEERKITPMLLQKLIMADELSRTRRNTAFLRQQFRRQAKNLPRPVDSNMANTPVS